MDFFEINLKEVIEAINELRDNNIHTVNTKKIRRCYHIKSSNRSKINFIWRSLDYLEKAGILEVNGAVMPKSYKIKNIEKIDVEDFILKVYRKKKKNI